MKRQGRQLKKQYATLSEEEVAARWRALRPRSLRVLGITGGLTVAAFLYNHVMHLSQQAHDYLTIGFQICAVFAVCSCFMLIMSFLFGREGEAAG